MAEPDAAVIVSPNGQPARASAATCPRCGSGPDQRVLSAGFGEPHPICTRCGYEFGEGARG